MSVHHKKIAVLGGDARQEAVCLRLAEQNLQVCCFGASKEEPFTKEVVAVSDWREAVQGAFAIILPLPAAPDGIHLNLPLATDLESPLLCDIFAYAEKSTVIIGGKMTPSIKEQALSQGLRVFDYFESEALQQKNALPTAEGAVFVLMRELPRTISGLSVGVTGFGRVAKALIKLLLAMGAEVTVIARKPEDLIAAASLGCKTVLMKNSRSFKRFTAGKHVIFNTVPYWLFTEEVLAQMSPSTLMIDLASAPGGVDANAASLHGIKVIFALSLPGKYAPVTAGEIIAETIWEYMKTEGLV